MSAEGVTAHTRAAARPAHRLDTVGRGAGWAALARAVAVLTLVGAAVVHDSVVGVHYVESPLRGSFFVALATAATFLSMALVVFRSRSLLAAAVAVSLGTVVLWTVSRTVGVPVGPDAWEAEPAGRADVIATVLRLT